MRGAWALQAQLPAQPHVRLASCLAAWKAVWHPEKCPLFFLQGQGACTACFSCLLISSKYVLMLDRAKLSTLAPEPRAIAAVQRAADFMPVEGGLVRLLYDALQAQPGMYRAALCGTPCLRCLKKRWRAPGGAHHASMSRLQTAEGS